MVVFSKNKFSNKDILSINYQTESLDLDEMINRELFVIDYNNDEDSYNILSIIRNHPNRNIYLKPVFLMVEEEQGVNKYITDLFDGKFTYDEFKKKDFNKSKIDKIHEKILTLPENIDDISNIGFKVLRFIYSRDVDIIPTMNAHTIYGYSVPLIDPFFKRDSDSTVYDILDLLENKNLIKGDFFDRVHLCPSCTSSFLNFKEVCPHCNSVNIENKTLIHHFACAYVGPEEDFHKGHHKTCPKCLENLKHIGVDYDKPSNVYHCNSCSYEFQEPEINITCFNCHSNHELEDIRVYDIKKYRLSALAKNSAIFGFHNLFVSFLNDNIDLLPLTMFKKYLELELFRINRYKKSESTLVVLGINNIAKIIDNKKIDNEILFKELSDIILSFLRTTDVICEFNESTFLILLTETSLNNSKIATERLVNEINSLLKNNLSEEIYSETHEISLNENGDMNIEELIKMVSEYEFS